MDLITKGSATVAGLQLKSIAPSLNIDHANALAASMNKILPFYGMLNKDVLPEFIAQLAHESQEFTAKTENLNYSAQAILSTWPSRFKSIEEATPFARNPQALANKVYNGRMGNATGSNDGWIFRGSGFMQMTGKDSVMPYYTFKRSGKGYKFDVIPSTLQDLVNLLRTSDEWALDGACWEFAISKGLIDEAIANEFVRITKAINGGLIGIKSRQMYYQRALQVFI